jgi:hypothetical protein
VIWSPYQKLSVQQIDRVGDPDPLTYILVNKHGLPGDVRPAAGDHAQQAFEHGRAHGLTQYDIPFLLHDHPDHVLISGAGSGNDVSGRLRNGATDVVAVDIDPRSSRSARSIPSIPTTIRRCTSS